MTRAIATTFTERQARAITDQINAKSGELFSLLQQAHDGGAWAALGYSNWRDYATAEFSVSQSRAYQLLAQARVVTEIREAANSTLVEISERQARDIKPILADVKQEIRAKVEAGVEPVQATYAVIEAKRVEHRENSTKVEKVPPPAALAPEPATSEVERLRAELVEARDNARELAALVESYDSVTAGEHAAAKEMAKLRAQLRTVEATRDQWMTTASELRREVKALQRKLGARQ